MSLNEFGDGIRNFLMRPIGFSTGAVAKADFNAALQLMFTYGVDVVELSALRFAELDPLIDALPKLNLKSFRFVSIHAPSSFKVEEEAGVVSRLMVAAALGYPIIVHPDVIFTPLSWARLGDRLTIENMDKRKPVGRTVAELNVFFEVLPFAKFCFDIAHARQVDPSMIEAALLLRAYGDRLAEVHVSEVNTASRHDPISRYAIRDFRRFGPQIPLSTPIIVESLIHQGQSDIVTEIRHAAEAFAIDNQTAEGADQPYSNQLPLSHAKS